MAARGAADHWEFFHCRMGEDIAYVMVNITIGERIARVAPAHLLIAKVVYPEPRDNGLPSSQDSRRRIRWLGNDGYEIVR